MLDLQKSMSIADPRLGKQYTYLTFECPITVVFYGHGIGALEQDDTKSGLLTIDSGCKIVLSPERVTGELPNVEWLVGHSFILYLVAVDDVSDFFTVVLLSE